MPLVSGGAIESAAPFTNAKLSLSERVKYWAPIVQWSD